MKLSVADFDHPLVFLLFLTLALIPMMALTGMLLQRLGFPGPAALVAK